MQVVAASWRAPCRQLKEGQMTNDNEDITFSVSLKRLGLGAWGGNQDKYRQQLSTVYSLCIWRASPPNDGQGLVRTQQTGQYTQSAWCLLPVMTVLSASGILRIPLVFESLIWSAPGSPCVSEWACRSGPVHKTWMFYGFWLSIHWEPIMLDVDPLGLRIIKHMKRTRWTSTSFGQHEHYLHDR